MNCISMFIGTISEPVCTYCARIFVKYDLMYLNVYEKPYVQIRTRYVPIYVQYTFLHVCDTDMSVSYTDMSVSHMYRKYWTIFAILHVSERILVNAFLLLPPCSPALACAPARGRCTFAWAQARGRCTFKFDALSLRQVRRAGSADAGE
jgi:hypothetical protein